MAAPLAGSSGAARLSLLREVLEAGIAEGGDALDLRVRAVDAWELSPSPGLITSEPLADQGLERRLPNAPDTGGAAEGSEPAGRSVTLRLRAPAPGVVRLTVVAGSGPVDDDAGAHHGILVDPAPRPVPLEVDEDGGEIRVRAGDLTVVVRRRPFAFSVEDASGAELVAGASRRRQVAGFPLAADIAVGDGAASISTEIRPGERILGLGEHFGSPVHNGGSFDLVATDALGAGTGLTYKSVPLAHSTAGYSLFLHTGGPVSVDAGARYPAVLSAEVEEPRLDAFFLFGTLKERLGLYCDLTGHMPVPPRWAFGVWMSRCRYRSRAELDEVAGELRSRGIGCDVLHIDPDWLERDLLNTDFVWSEEKYPDPKGMFEGLHAQGFRVSVWECPYLDPESAVAQEAASRGLIVRDGDGDPATVRRTFTRDGRPRWLVDFSRPEARRWWQEGNRGLLELGADVIKCDFGEGLPDDAVMADGRPGRAWRNLYPLWYSRTVFELVGDQTGRAPLVWSRSGWAGSQRYPAQWGGDPEASVAGLAAEIRAGLSWAVSAPGLWAHDIGGFYGDGPSPGLYVRWAQAGCLSPLTRFHGLTPREPWAFGADAESIVARMIELRYRLLPYLLSTAHASSAAGLPVMRPLVLEFPEMPELAEVDHEFLLGEDLLVVPVLDDAPGDAEVSVVIPPGRWVDWFTGESYDGPAQVRTRVPLDRFPLLVRAGAVIPCGPAGRHTGEIPADEWHLRVFPGPVRTTQVHDGTATYRYTPRPGPSGEFEAVEAFEPEARARSATLVVGDAHTDLPVEAGTAGQGG